MQNIWWLPAVLLSLLTASYVYINQFVRVKGAQLMVYRGLGAALLLLPFVFFIQPLHNPYFYVLCIAQGFVISYGDNRILNAAKIFGAEVTSLIHPLSIGIIFLLWLVLHPFEFAEMLRVPVHFFLIFACLIGISAAIILICHSKMSRKALSFLLLGMFCEVFIDVSNKETTHLGAENVYAAVFYYTLITSFVAGLANLTVYLRSGQKLPSLFKKSNFNFMWFFIIYAVLHSMMKTYTMYLSPNPAYVAAVVHAYPVWIMLANSLYSIYRPGYKTNRVNVFYLLLLLVCMTGLVLIVHED